MLKTWFQKLSANSAGFKSTKAPWFNKNNKASCKTVVILALAMYAQCTICSRPLPPRLRTQWPQTARHRAGAAKSRGKNPCEKPQKFPWHGGTSHLRRLKIGGPSPLKLQNPEGLGPLLWIETLKTGRSMGNAPDPRGTANLHTKILDFGGF